jgi:streptogramin lyase
MARLQPGTVLAGYRIEAVAGEGGMGVVYRATQLGLDRQVALKLITPDLAEDAEFRQRFNRESRLTASIEHPHVIPVYEAGEADGQLFISMRFIHGTDLRAVIVDEGRLEPRRAARILAQVASALDAAHAHGLIHRDIKPANVLIAQQDGADHAYLTDFGLTKQLGSQSGLTRTGAWVGTLDYIAPEQIMGTEVDARSDVYALGCVLFQMLAGQVPYERDSDVAKLWAHMNEPPPRLSTAAPGIPKALDLVLGRALAKEPADRHPSASDLARAVEAGIEGRQVTVAERSVARGPAAPTVTRVSRDRATHIGATVERARRLPLPAFAAGGAAALVLGAAVLLATGALSDDGGDGAGSGAAAPPRGASSVTITSIPVDSPSGMAVGDGGVWVASYESDRVTRIDERTATAGKPVEVGDGPAALALTEDALWVSQSDAGTIGRVELAQGRVVGNPIPLPSSDGDALEIGEGALWASDPGESLVGRIDPKSGKLVERIAVKGGVEGDIAVGEGGVWAVNAESATVTRIDPGQNAVEGKPIEVGEQFEDSFGGNVAVGAGSVWASSPEDDTVVRIDPASGEVTGRVRLPSGVSSDLAVGLGQVWTFDDESQLVRIDPGNLRVKAERVPVGITGGDEIEIAGGALWLSGNFDADRVVRIQP